MTDPILMPLFEAIRLALGTLRVQKLKSFFTLIGVTISVMFLIAVVSIVQGMNRYVEEDFAGKFLGVNTFNLRRYPDIQNDVTEDEWKAWQRRPRVTIDDALAVREALPSDARWAMHGVTRTDASSKYQQGGPRVLAEAATPSYLVIKDLGIARGRVYNDQEEEIGAPVIIIGEEMDERTREMRIRKSLSARRRDILAQFLVESATVSSVGALLGVGLGIALAELVAKF